MSVVAPGQGADVDKLGLSIGSPKIMVCGVYSLESHQNTTYIFMIK